MGSVSPLASTPELWGGVCTQQVERALGIEEGFAELSALHARPAGEHHVRRLPVVRRTHRGLAHCSQLSRAGEKGRTDLMTESA